MCKRTSAGSTKLFLMTLLAGGTLGAVGCGEEMAADEETLVGALSASSPTDRAMLALRWAPVHRQDVDTTGSQGLGGASDYITRVDYDGDFVANNNWDNASRFALSAHAYASVVETSTHWFITYMFYHPRDWTDVSFTTAHENDAEGVMLTVARDGSASGVLQAAVTVAHSDFYSFVPAGSPLGSGAHPIDGTLSMQAWDGGDHPVTAQEAKGHGLKAVPYVDIIGDGLVYFPSATLSEVPSNSNDRDVRYTLSDIFAAGGLWERRNNTSVFSSFGVFSGNTTGGCNSFPYFCTSNSANAPWGWDDDDDLPARGVLATDPIQLVQNYFSIPGSFSTSYTFNPYLGIGG